MVYELVLTVDGMGSELLVSNLVILSTLTQALELDTGTHLRQYQQLYALSLRDLCSRDATLK